MIKNTKQIKIIDVDNLPIYRNKRNCYSELLEFADSGNGRKGQICALYGLRRTGKTVLTYQLAQEMKHRGHKTLYLSCPDELANISMDVKNKVKHTPEIAELFSILDKAIEENYEFVFIDEVTFIKDFVGQGNVLSNYYSNQGLNIIVAGTDSLSFAIESYDDMYDRIKMLHTGLNNADDYPYAEYLDIAGIDKQLKSILEILNMNEMSVRFRQADIDIIKDSLKELDLVLTMPLYESVGGELYKKDELKMPLCKMVNLSISHFMMKHTVR